MTLDPNEHLHLLEENRLMRDALRDIMRLTQRVMLPTDGDTVGWQPVATKRLKEIRKLAYHATVGNMPIRKNNIVR